MISELNESVRGALSRIPISSYRVAVIMPLVVLFILSIGAMAVMAAEPSKIHIDGEELDLSGPARVVDGRMFVPLRDIVPITGGTLLYDENTGVARVLTPTTRFMLVASRPKAYTNSGEDIDIPAPIAEDGQLLVWIRFLAEAFDWELEWDSESSAVSIDTSGGAEVDMSIDRGLEREDPGKDSEPEKAYDISDSELDLLMRLVSAEAHGEPIEGKTAVAAVVFNRVKSGHFPDTVEAVIEQDGQFCVVTNGRIETSVRDGAREAVKTALTGQDPSEGALFFFNPAISDSQYMHSLPVTVEIGSHRFADWGY